MVTKQTLYEIMAERLGNMWEVDAAVAGQRIALWISLRTFDDWLVEHRENPLVSVEQYARNCSRYCETYEQLRGASL